MSRRRLGELRDLALLQRAAREAAGGDVAAARAREADAIERADAAADRVAAVAGQWYAATAAMIGPEVTGMLGQALVAAETDEAARVAALRDAVRDHEATIDRWRHLDAHSRAGERIADDVAKRVKRRREETALAVLADRVTLDWRRR